MNRRILFRVALGVTPLVAFVLYAALNWYEVEETKYRSGLSEEAMRDPYLALTRLLGRMGARSEFTKSPLRLASPPEGGVLLLGPNRLAYMTRSRVRELDAWVQRGGWLVAQSERWGIDDPLLDHFGLERYVPPEEMRNARGGAAKKSREAEAVRKIRTPDDFIVSVPWPGATRALRVRQFGVGLRFADDTELPAGLVGATLDGKLAVATFPSGRGRVTFVKDLSFLRNPQLGELDHAEFAWRLATAAPEGKPALLFLRAESPSLWEWIRENAWTVLVGGTVLILLWLSRIVPRFGPLEPEPAPVRRSLLEHLRAAGRYTWSRGDIGALVDAVRERAWRTALRRRGGLKGLAHSKAQATLAELSGRPAATVQRAMEGTASSPAAFVATAGALQEIEAGLAHRARPLNRRNREKNK